MSLHQKITADLKGSLKANDSFRTGTLRMLLAVLHNKEIEKKGKGLEPELKDDEVFEVLGREAKKRREAAEIYNKGNRRDLEEKEIGELGIITAYLPKQLGAEEIQKVVSSIIEKMMPLGQKDFGRVMSEAMKELKGKAEASLVSEIVKKKLGS